MEYLDYIEDDEVDRIIIEERNKETRQIEKDIYTMSEIFVELSEMVHEQGEQIRVNEKIVQKVNRDVAESIKKLADAEDMHMARTKIIRDIAIVFGGLGLGACGFLVGPIVGLSTLVSGVGLGSGIVYASHKTEK